MPVPLGHLMWGRRGRGSVRSVRIARAQVSRERWQPIASESLGVAHGIPRALREQEVGGSNPLAPTDFLKVLVAQVALRQGLSIFRIRWRVSDSCSREMGWVKS